MPVEIRLYGRLRDAAGVKSVTRTPPEGTTVSTLLESLGKEYPELAEQLFDDDGTVRNRVIVRKNRTTLDALSVPVGDGDRIAVATQVVGGEHTPPGAGSEQ